MTDETEHDKQYSSGCEFTDEYLDRNFELFNFTKDYYFIERIGIRLSCDEALIYSQLPAFQVEFLESIYNWHEIRASLYFYSQGNFDVKNRLKDHKSTLRLKLGLNMKIKEVVDLAIPVYTWPRQVKQDGVHLSRVLSGCYQKHERGFVRDVVDLIKGGWLKSVNRISAEMHMPALADHSEVMKYLESLKGVEEKYPYIVVNLLDLESVGHRLRRPVSREILKIWRQYLDLQDAELKQAAIQIESPVKHYSDSSSIDNSVIPEAFKKKKFTGKLEKLILKAYISFLEKEGKKPNNCEELFLWMTNENMPDDVLFLDLAPTDKSERGKKGLWLIKRSCGKSEHDWNTFRNTCNSLLSF